MSGRNPISSFFERLGRRRAIKRFLTALPRHLFGDYGHTGPYTPMQVESTIRRYRVGDLRHSPYAVAIFCDPAKLAELRREAAGPYDYREMREEVGLTFFGGDSEFTPRDVATYGGHAGAEASGGPSGHDGGHHGADTGGSHH